MYVEERRTEIGTDAQKGHYEDLQKRASKDNEMIFK